MKFTKSAIFKTLLGCILRKIDGIILKMVLRLVRVALIFLGREIVIQVCDMRSINRHMNQVVREYLKEKRGRSNLSLVIL
ncbi:hypothetical protein WM40_05560 [Robbsia andropogonis]|uniref:Uncharacterized protein n=1 Tax=Robbsia andropogonis TaxID=28092 RepID=A0A0F5K2N8_9BURK|nr:hypothetical protein WM40_05560 [Robbsia andropogonis]